MEALSPAFLFMNAMQFKTPQEIIQRKNVNTRGYWLLGIDAGFSSLKGFAPNKTFCFPSYVRKLDRELLMPNQSDILYRDETGLYLIGASAQEQVTSDDTSDSESELFVRNRYTSKKFQIILAVGMAIGLTSNSYMERKKDMPVIIQTGLPTAYVRSDREKITKAFAKRYVFDLKMGYGAWEHHDIEIPRENIFVLPQPSGTLYSILIDESGKYVPNAPEILKKNLLIVDAGFGTFDPYGLVNRQVVLEESLPDLGMKKILQETSSMIFDKYGEEIRVPAMQKYLGKGTFTYLNEEERKSEEIVIAPFLEAANKKVCMESIKVLEGMCNSLKNYNYLILTGGTCAAWYDLYRDYFGWMKSLTIIPGNKNDKLPMYYSNVRGYYMYRHMLLKAGGRS